jgi:ribosomal protein L37AE/L43A
MGLKAEAEVRGPARFFYDKSTYPASYSLAQESKTANPVPRGDCSFAGEAVDLGARKERSTSVSPGKETKTQARCCVMCNHCWHQEVSKFRSTVYKCPNCLSDQPGDAYLTEEELQAMAERCKEWDRKSAEERRAAMADASRHRSAMKKRGYSYAGASD